MTKCSSSVAEELRVAFLSEHRFILHTAVAASYGSEQKYGYVSSRSLDAWFNTCVAVRKVRKEAGGAPR